MAVAVNGRVLLSPGTGVQRYVASILEASGSGISKIQPRSWLSVGLPGHFWEQAILPARCRSSLLWSPSNTGPLSVHNQVVTLHDVVPLDHPEWLTSRFAAFYRFLIPRLARRVKHIITISEFSKNRILHHTGLKEDRVTVIHNGVGNQFTPAAGQSGDLIRQRYGLQQGTYVLSLSTLEPRKNLPRLLEAWRALPGHLKEGLVLAVAGGIGRPSIFQSEALSHVEGVRFLGRVPETDLPALYACSRGVAYPSLYEGFGLPPLEAMACQVPVVTSDCTAIPEVVSDAAILVDPHDVFSIRDGLQYLLTDDSAMVDLARKGRARAQEFTWNTCARLTMDLLETYAAE